MTWCRPRPWALRGRDFDPAGHVNNAIHWDAVEDVLAGADWLPARAELENDRPILPGCDLRLVVSDEPGDLRTWFLDGSRKLASAWLCAPLPT